MATYYVAKTGNDATGDGTNPSTPYLTIAAAIGDAGTSGDTVEIIDEGNYEEDNTIIDTPYLTIQHTASWLGRPAISGRNTQLRAFRIAEAAVATTYIGLEIQGYTGYIFNDDGSGGAGYDRFHMSGCFIHSVPKLGSSNFEAPSSNPATIKQCIMFFEPGSSTRAITVNGAMEIYNCLITGSNGDNDSSLLYDYGANGTASFCTIINRTDDTTGGASSAAPIIRFSQVGNCIVSASNEYLSGIASDDRGYNAVKIIYDYARSSDVTAFRTFADVSASAGTGEIEVTPAQIGFVDGDSIGKTSTIAEDYKLTEASELIGAGLSTNKIYVDLIDTVRPQRDVSGLAYDIGAYEYAFPLWADSVDQPKYNFSGDFTSNTYTNLASNHTFRYWSDEDPGQAPFSLGTKGPSTLRGRTKAHKTTK